MGGDDSQKLLPWRGSYSSPGPKPPAHSKPILYKNPLPGTIWPLAAAP